MSSSILVKKDDGGFTFLAGTDDGAVKIASDTLVVEGEIEITESALPTGAATEAKQDAQETSLNAIQAAVESYPTGATPWTSTDVSAANTAKTITKAAVAGKSHYITAIEVSTKGADAASDIDVVLNEDNAGTPVAKWQEVIGTYAVSGSRCGIVFAKPIKLTAGKTADLVVDAGGASVVTVLNLQGFTL